VADLHKRASEAQDYTEAKALLDEASVIRHKLRDLEPGQ